jgi:7-carboxy-7-deazaguanine synthase
VPVTLPISETFYSIQGEGKLTGVPSFFIRTSGCNLRCAWCDTPYASWEPDGGQRAIDSLVQEALAARATHVVLTGGEPMMFPQIEALTHALRARNLHITIETAGTIFRTLPCDLMSISPKLGNSTPHGGRAFSPTHAASKMPPLALSQWAIRHEARRLNFPVLNHLLAVYPDHQLKFVVASDNDLAEIEAVLAHLSNWQPADILLMPEGTAPPSAASKEWITRACLARGWRYCQRLHLDLFGNKRGT